MMHPDPVLAALQAARRGPLDYESAMVLMIWGAYNLPIRPKTLGPRSGGVFWEEQPGKRRVKRDAAADVWKRSGGKHAVVTISDPNGFGPSLARRAGHISQ